MLGALDDKIELNQRMNVTLEEMAQAVFREWFVENPKAEEWGTASILEFAATCLAEERQAQPNQVIGMEILIWVSAKDVGNSGGYFLLETEKKITQAGLDNSSTKLLPEKTTIVTATRAQSVHTVCLGSQ